MFLRVTLFGFADTLVRFIDIEPTLDGSPFVFEVLILLEEMLNFLFEVVVDTAEISDIFEPWVFGRNCEDFPVASFFVFHVEDTNWSHFEYAAGEGWLSNQHEDIEVVTVISASEGDEPIVSRIEHR